MNEIKQDSRYFIQAELLLRIMPRVAAEKCFALKGGTAINFFVRDLPRLSVDIDLTYLPLNGRDTALDEISAALKRIALSIRKLHKAIAIQEISLRSKQISKLVVRNKEALIKIEPNEITRGTVFDIEERSITPAVEEMFGQFVKTQVLSFADLYGGKICAALDRQHPRDLFDIKLLLDNEGLTESIRQAFVVYLAGHDRPMHELLDPKKKDGRDLFDREFQGMTRIPVKYEDLVKAWEKLVSKIHNDLTLNERQFLLSIKEGLPNWNQMPLLHLNQLPSLQWKLKNIEKINKTKHTEQLANLKAILR